MRKSRMRSAQGHLGGVEEGVGIIPPAAANFDHAARPENDSILREVLSPEELSQISHYRTLSQSKVKRQYSHEEQVENDKKRASVAESKRRAARNVPSASPNGRKQRGEAFRLGKTAPLSAQEEAELTGAPAPVEVVVEPAEVPKKSKARKTKAKSKAKKAVPVTKEVAGEIPVPQNLPPPVEEAGGTPFFPNALGRNLRPTEPVTNPPGGRRFK